MNNKREHLHACAHSTLLNKVLQSVLPISDLIGNRQKAPRLPMVGGTDIRSLIMVGQTIPDLISLYAICFRLPSEIKGRRMNQSNTLQ